MKRNKPFNPQKTIPILLMLSFGAVIYLFYRVNSNAVIPLIFKRSTPTPIACAMVDSIEKVKPSVVKISSLVGDGSGFIIGDGKFIATNQHVVQDISIAQIAIPEKFSSWGKVVWKDEKVDLALIAISEELPTDPVVWGNSDKTRVGETVVSIGFPFGDILTGGASVTKGTLSARRFFKAGDVELLQTDTPINPGNSGGPLINECGEVIAINQSKCPPELGCEGLGFAIASNQARPLFEKALSGLKQTSSNVDMIQEETAKSIVRNYYSLINTKKFYQAYNLLSSEFRNTYNYEWWVVDIEPITSVNLDSIEFKSGFVPTVYVNGQETKSLGGKKLNNIFASELALVKEEKDWKLEPQQ